MYLCSVWLWHSRESSPLQWYLQPKYCREGVNSPFIAAHSQITEIPSPPPHRTAPHATLLLHLVPHQNRRTRAPHAREARPTAHRAARRAKHGTCPLKVESNTPVGHSLGHPHSSSAAQLNTALHTHSQCASAQQHKQASKPALLSPRAPPLISLTLSLSLRA